MKDQESEDFLQWLRDEKAKMARDIMRGLSTAQIELKYAEVLYICDEIVKETAEANGDEGPTLKRIH